MCSELSFSGNERRGAFDVRRVKSVRVKSSWEDLTDTARVEIPRVSDEFSGDKLREIFSVGDGIEIKLGYDGVLTVVFTGYITKVSAGQPIVLDCEDLMWRVKQEPVNYSGKNQRLPVFLQKVLPGYSIDAMDIELGSVRFSRTTMGEVMTKLKDDMGVYFFATPRPPEGGGFPILVAGKIHSRDLPEIEIVVEGSRENKLEYSSGDDKKVKVTASSTLSNGTKLTATAGDAGGSEVNLSFYNVKNKNELQKRADEALERYKIEGYTGHISCFGDVIVRHGYTVRLVSVEYPERNGTYYVDRVEHFFDDSPQYKIDVYLGRKAVSD